MRLNQYPNVTGSEAANIEGCLGAMLDTVLPDIQAAQWPDALEIIAKLRGSEITF